MSSSRIYTRTGDQGETSLVDGSRVSKSSLRVEAYGTIDEANSWVGAALAHVEDDVLRAPLTFLQHRLYNCSSSAATPPDSDVEPPSVSADDVTALEQAIDRLEERSGPITVFVLPGGTRVAGLLHVARTVCRRAERRLIELQRTDPVDPWVLKLVNRASDLLFAAARYENAVNGEGDVAWDRELPTPA